MDERGGARLGQEKKTGVTEILDTPSNEKDYSRLPKILLMRELHQSDLTDR